MEIQADNIILTKKELDAIKSIAWAWATFENNRQDYLGTEDDFKSIIKILYIPYLYDLITEEEYKKHIKSVEEFFQYDGNFFNNDSYTYEELDDFVEQLHPLYKKF